MKRIIIVEDDKKLNDGIKLALRHEYVCLQAFTIQDARELWKEQKADLILLDVNLPDGNGQEWLEEIRQSSNVPIIILTANNMEMDIVTGLELGANDYITKPFSLMVLRARVGVQLRDCGQEKELFVCQDYRFDFQRMEFYKGNESIVLSRIEQRLLRCLLEQKGRNVSRSQLIDAVWQGEEEYVEEHALTVVVNRLRKKLGDELGSPIKTIYGMGYAWTMERG